MNREDFNMLDGSLIYFDNGATTLKPNQVVDSIVEYYTKYTANAHRGDYDNSLKVDMKYDEVRVKVKNFIDANSDKEVVFTKGTTESLNLVIFGYMKYNLKSGDEVLITKAEHASNVLPWLELQKEIGIVVKYIPLNDRHEIDMKNLINAITDKTKVISIAHVTNVIGDVRPVYEIGRLCENRNIYFVVDGAQSTPHMKVSVKDMNASFYAFSAHKMLGPTGIGVLYGKKELLDKTKPLVLGGGMNTFFESDGTYEYQESPVKFEGGTQHIAGVIGLGAAIDYIENIGIEKIHKYELELKKYLVDKLSNINNIEIYNKDIIGGAVAFNIKDIFAQDTAVYLNKYKICVRAGNHCAKILKDELNVKNTCRISLYFYNTYEEIDKLIEVLSNSDNIFDIIL